MEKTPKTIALVANTSWNLVHFRSSLAEKLRGEGYRVLAIAPPGPYSERLVHHPFSRFYAWQRLRAHGQRLFQEWLAIRELRRLYETLRPDLVLHFTIKPNLYGSREAARLGIPSISTITGLGYPFLHPEGANRFVPFLYKRALRGASVTVFQNEDDRRLFLERGMVEAAKARLIPGSGVDTRFFQPAPEMASADAFSFLYAGRLLRDKGILEYLAAGRRLADAHPGVRIWIAGEIEPENPAALTRAELDPYFSHPSFHYWGFQEDIRTVMARCDVFVLPSYREGMPRAVLEAMSMGKPILTTLAAGCKDTVEPGENGLLVAPRDPEALFRAMQQFLQWDTARLQIMGRRSRAMAMEKFDIQAINQQFMDLIGQLLAYDHTTRTSPVLF